VQSFKVLGVSVGFSEVMRGVEQDGRVWRFRGLGVSVGSNKLIRKFLGTKPLSSEYGARTTVKARFWPWLAGKSP